MGRPNARPGPGKNKGLPKNLADAVASKQPGQVFTFRGTRFVKTYDARTVGPLKPRTGKARKPAGKFRTSVQKPSNAKRIRGSG